MNPSIADLLQDHQFFHSDLQMDSFITIRAGGTLYGCYKQALRELQTRVSAMRTHTSAVAILEIEIEEHEQADSKRDRIHAVTKRRALQETRRLIQDSLRELGRFYGQAVAIRESFQAKGIEFPLDAETRHLLDCEMWTHQLKCRAVTDLLSVGHIQATTLELLQALPLDWRQSMRKEIIGVPPEKLIDWFMAHDPQIPAPKIIEPETVSGLLECSELSALPKRSQTTSLTAAPTQVLSSLPNA
jgi:hypothetical protein